MENKNNLLVKMENAGVYLNNKWLVKDVTLNIEKGKIITLIGPNGSGKTTTAKIALGLYKNISGKVEKYTKKLSRDGLIIDAISHCPHHPNYSKPNFKDCNCRKPKPGMIFNAVKEFNNKVNKSK